MSEENDERTEARERGPRKRALLLVLFGALAIALAATGALAHPVQHGPDEGHLLGSGEWGNIHKISHVDVTDTKDLVADVAVSPDGNWAYLANWGRADCDANSEAGGQNNPDAGVWVIDIKDPANPQEVGFIPHSQDSRPGEGMQVLDVSTKWFKGQMLAMNNEQCGKNGKGGVSLYDVSNPRKPVMLSENFGDRGFADTNDTHSAFAWDAGDRAYLVMTDNLEFPDVDILDITNPKRPRLIKEYDLNDFGVAQPEYGLTDSFLHDMIVKEIGGRFIMLLSNWDGGYVQLDVTDPANAQFLGDTDYAGVDPELADPANAEVPADSRDIAPQGNGHQAEFTSDNKFFISTDEDFGPYRASGFKITTGPNQGEYPSVIVPGGASVDILEDGQLNGPTAYVGYACDGSAPVPPRAQTLPTALGPGEEAIAVVQRGPSEDPSAPEEACFPGEKAANATAAGYDAVVFAQRHQGSAEADQATPYCGSGGYPAEPIVSICTTHEAFHKLFNTEPNFALPYQEGTEPAIGSTGEKVDVSSVFDGWGYVHLFDRESNEDLDTYAIDEAFDPGYANGFGDLTVHEVATDKNDPLKAYLSYYAGGMRAIEIRCSDPKNETTCELVETGGYLDEKGNDFWGVETFSKEDDSGSSHTYVLGSDMDDGLWIFEADDHAHGG